jgi:hypothetical protein
MLKKETIDKNKRIFQQTNEKYQIFTKKLLEFLGEEIYKAPASTKASLYNACEGGLLDHMIKVAKYSAILNEVLPENIRSSKESIMKVAFLCEIGKVFLYEENTKVSSEYVYDYKKDQVAMLIGERSLFYALSNGVMLTEEESQAILNVYKSDDDKMSKWFSSSLSMILKTAVDFAIIEERGTKK